MRLRSQLLLFLFLFGFTPLLVALAISLPLVFEGLELFYHKSHLQNLRADFRDIDQYLAGRREMVRLLAKLPEPGLLMAATEDDGKDSLDVARARYTEQLNRMLWDQPDIIQILFLDDRNQPLFWLERDPLSHILKPTDTLPFMPSQPLLDSLSHMQPGSVGTSPISIDALAGSKDPRRQITLRMASQIIAPINIPPRFGAPDRSPGTVLIDIDIGGLASVHSNTFWVLDDGHYLDVGQTPRNTTAFEDFPGLKAVFEEGKLSLWESKANERVIWVPLFATDQSGPLWVGRTVDESPLDRVRTELAVRVLLIILAMIVFMLIIARWFALRAERFGDELLRGVKGVLAQNEPVRFAWRGPRELRTLGRELTRLGRSHVEKTAAMRAHAAELEESNRYKSEFLANVSHELRTPLNSILLLSKLLGSDSVAPLSAEQAQQVRVIHDAGSDLMGLINNILDLSRIDAGKIRMHLSEVYLPDLIRDIEELFRPQVDAAGLPLRTEIEPDAPETIHTDAEKLAQIIRNFLGNAVKFTAAGEIVLSVTKNASRRHPDLAVCISVSDTGIGIPEDKQGYVFEAFEQADSSTRRRYGGTGLGLTISRELSKLLGGVIELDSREGQGSTFSLLLPLRLDGESDVPIDFEPAQLPLRTARDPEPEPVRVSTARPSPSRAALVLDNNLRDLLQLSPMMEQLGYAVTAAGDLEEALETLQSGDRFDLVLADIMVKSADDQDLLARIRAHGYCDKVPVILMTNSAAEDSDETPYTIEKPITESRLRTVLENVTRSEFHSTSVGDQ